MGALCSILTFAQCSLPRVLWEGLKKVPEAKCWAPMAFSHFAIATASTSASDEDVRGPLLLKLMVIVSGYNAFMDVCLAVLPVTFIYNLNMKAEKRLSLSIQLSTGVL